MSGIHSFSISLAESPMRNALPVPIMAMFRHTAPLSLQLFGAHSIAKTAKQPQRNPGRDIAAGRKYEIAASARLRQRIGNFSANFGQRTFVQL